MSREQDLIQLEQEEEKVMEWAVWINRDWTRKWKEDAGGTEEVKKVVCFGKVELMDDEIKLLNKDLDYMVVVPLNMSVWSP